MINLKQRPDVGWNLLLGVSLVGILVAAWFGFAKPADYTPAKAWRKSLAKVTDASRKANDKADADLAVARKKIWDVDLNALGSVTLDRLTELSQKHRLQLTGFRTDKPVEVGSLREAPFVLVVDGAFPDLVEFVKSLEGPESKLAVNLLQISSSDAVAGHVTATLGLVGFTLKEDL